MPEPAVMTGVLRHLRRTERRRLYGLLGDGELFARFVAERDQCAFEELIHRHGPMVRAVCRRVLGPTADADDAFQATFLILIRKARAIRRTDLLANWLCAVAYRASRQALRRRYRLGIREQAFAVLPEPARQDDPPRDWLPLFDAVLQRLPAKYREPVVLCELQGLARPEAARRLGLNEGTLSSRLGRARDLLRKRLAPHGFPLAIGSGLAPVVVPEALTASTAAASLSISSASVTAIVLSEGVLTAMFASKLKTGAACAAVLVAGVVSSLQFTGPATVAGGEPAKDGPPLKETAKTESAPSKADQPPKATRLSADYEPFQGDWVVSEAENGNAIGTAAAGVDNQWRFTGDSLTTGGEIKEDAVEKFTLDSRAKPATIDFVLNHINTDGSGRFTRAAYHGVYKFEPDGTLLICYRVKTDDGRNLRPTRFAVAPNFGATLLTLRRPAPPESPIPPIAPINSVPPPALQQRNLAPPVTPAPLAPPKIEVPPPAIPMITIPDPAPVSSSSLPPSPSTAFDALPERPPVTTSTPSLQPSVSDLERFQGAWTRTQNDGKSVRPPSDEPAHIIEFVKDRILTEGGSHGRYRLEEAKSPKRIAFEMPKEGGPKTAIYQIDGDKLVLAYCNKSNKLIPTDFTPDPENNISVEVYERVKGDRPAKVEPPPRVLNSDAAPIQKLVPPAAADAILAVNSTAFRLPYMVSDPKQTQTLRLYRSDDQGRSWTTVARVNVEATEGSFDVTVPNPGTYWFAIQAEGADGKGNPSDTFALEPLVKVKVEPNPATAKPPERDVLKEIEQLREQLQRLEKELKDRKK